MGVFIAIVIVLQIMAGFVKFGPFPITLALAPIVVGAAVYGKNAGALLGGAFGAVVLIYCIIGVDPGGFILWSANPALTAALCLLKGILAGYAAGAVYSALSKDNVYLGVICAALICPIVNTGIFLFAMNFFYRDILIEWAGGASLIYFLFIGIAGINFLVEVAVNMALGSTIFRIIKVRSLT
jgi:uncharacterized membrane protein